MRILIAFVVFISSFQSWKGSAGSAQNRVYICVSSTAYAYHDNLNCRGLRSCTHKIDTVTIKTAIAKYKRKACGYCY